MLTSSNVRRRTLLAASAAATAAAASAVLAPPASAHDSSDRTDGHAAHPSKPTVVLVHGAFADASGWADVTATLQRAGYPVLSPANPLRSIPGDADFLRALLGTITGPIVLAGHSYGGAVLTNAATGNSQVKALVYVAAFALAQDETVQAALGLGGGSSDLANHLVVRPFPGAAPGDGDGYIDPAFFHQLFCADLPTRQAAIMATAQRPAALRTFGDPSGAPAWRSIPSWYVVAKRDQTIPPAAQRVMAARAKARTTEVSSSHVAMISHPDVVSGVITAAARATVAS